MSRRIHTGFLILIFSAITLFHGFADNGSPFFIPEKQLPDNLIYGRVPKQARDTIKKNPWILDRASMAGLSRAIYHNPNVHAIQEMQMVILAKKTQPYNDDIVYYIFRFRDNHSADMELKKIQAVTDLYRDKTILLHSDKTAVLIISDRASNYPSMVKVSRILNNLI